MADATMISIAVFRVPSVHGKDAAGDDTKEEVDDTTCSCGGQCSCAERNSSLPLSAVGFAAALHGYALSGKDSSSSSSSCSSSSSSTPPSPALLCIASDVSKHSWYTRRTVREFLRFTSRAICADTAPGTFNALEHDDQTAMCRVDRDGLAAVVIYTRDMNQRIAHEALKDIMRTFREHHGYGSDCHHVPSWHAMAEMGCDGMVAAEALKKWKNPREADKVPGGVWHVSCGCV